jgi:hypothetical protein
MQPNKKGLLIEGCFYRVWFFEVTNIELEDEFFKTIRALYNHKSSRFQGALYKAINPIAGRLLSSRAHFLFRFISVKL